MPTIIPDYEKPAAVMVAHFQCDLTPLLESIATAAAKTVGVILVTPDREFTNAFVAAQPNPDHFSIVTAPIDSPWIRDRSPIAIKRGKDIRWCVPQWEYESRPNDTVLFQRICAEQHSLTPIAYLPQGNLVTGHSGLAFMSKSILKKNDLKAAQLTQFNSALGVRDWIVFDAFTRESTGHADVHVRVLKRHLYAVAWNLTSKRDRDKSEKIIAAVEQHDEKAEILKIPIRSKSSQYASTVNWLQLGNRLLIPRYSITPAEDVTQIDRLLAEYGFNTEFIYSPTLHIQGSIHCLTGSIYV